MPAATEAESSNVSLSSLLRAGAPGEEIEQHLDGLPADARLAQVLRIRGRGVKALYEAAADRRTASLEELIPANAKKVVIYEGRNSLAGFSRFQKRFARVEGGVVVGYNHQTMSFVTGPGFFVVKPASGVGEHAKELLFDYTAEPPAIPAGWPAYKPNTSGLSRLVYASMYDFVRRVARGVIVGKAYTLREDGLTVDRDAYFSLTLP